MDAKNIEKLVQKARDDSQNADGTLKLEKVKSVDDLTNEDFYNPTSIVAQPSLPAKVDNVSLEKKIRQAVKERGLILTLESAAANTQNDLSFDGKDKKKIFSTKRMVLNRSKQAHSFPINRGAWLNSVRWEVLYTIE